MKLVRCTIAPHHLTELIEGLRGVVTGMTVWEVKKPEVNDKRASYRGVNYTLTPPALAVEMVTDDSWADDILIKLAEINRRVEFLHPKIEIFHVEGSYQIRMAGLMDR